VDFAWDERVQVIASVLEKYRDRLSHDGRLVMGICSRLLLPRTRRRSRTCRKKIPVSA
jgi:hypothetical protein